VTNNGDKGRGDEQVVVLRVVPGGEGVARIEGGGVHRPRRQGSNKGHTHFCSYTNIISLNMIQYLLIKIKNNGLIRSSVKYKVDGIELGLYSLK